MAKRMIIMLTVVAVLLAALGFVKFKRDPDRNRGGRGVSTAA
jgi:hypothetical protein